MLNSNSQRKKVKRLVPEIIRKNKAISSKYTEGKVITELLKCQAGDILSLYPQTRSEDINFPEKRNKTLSKGFVLESNGHFTILCVCTGLKDED